MLRPMLRSFPRHSLRLAYLPLPRNHSTLSAPKITKHHITSTLRPYAAFRDRPRLTQPVIVLAAGFHSTSRREGLPLIPIFASIFKASTGFEIARTASRIALTFIPLLWFSNKRSQKMMQFAQTHGLPSSEEQKAKHLKGIKKRTFLLQILFLIPFLSFWATVIASLERTPVTGRWRMILLSPEEEDDIAQSLAGPGWFQSVGEILNAEGSPRLIPTNDWRYQWILNTLRKLEESIPVLASEPELCPHWIEGSPEQPPLPPPAKFPLRPRPRASEYLRWFCNKLTKQEGQPVMPLPDIPGPPYSLLLVEKPDASNAFSYGFGPDGGSGIVVYSGFIDDVLSKVPDCPPPAPAPKESFWSSLFGSLFSSSPPPHPEPTIEQTTELAILLSHEMAHLILSHHLESLSSVTVIVPGTLSIAADVIRVLLFPITMIFGPFVNDAVAQLGKVGSLELAKISEYCTSIKQEIEADVVSARILAHAGYDAREAVKFWEKRDGSEAECARHGNSPSPPVARSYMGASHPVSDVRVQCLREELDRWEEERVKARYHSPASAHVETKSSASGTGESSTPGT